MRIGHGYDVHKLVVGRDLVLGGEKIPFEKGLDGHSDADVLIHAIMDSLLGALALGDIGKIFPDTDDEFKDAYSLDLLSRVYKMVCERSWKLSNLDATIICQSPKLAEYIDQMRENIARACGVKISQISIKATTEEKLGFTGAGEGIAAHCVCLLVVRN